LCAGHTQRLEDVREHAMVRHEAAEALGAIADAGVEPLLTAYLKDRDAIVSESCSVALDIADYWNSPDQFDSVDAAAADSDTAAPAAAAPTAPTTAAAKPDAAKDSAAVTNRK
jgi:hypothetical protein